MSNFLGKHLCCEAQISHETPVYKVNMVAAPCFGVFFRALKLPQIGAVITNFKADVFQMTDLEIQLASPHNNYCVLSFEQVLKYHKEIEKICNVEIPNCGPTEVKLEVVPCNKSFGGGDNIIQNVPAYKITATAKVLTPMQAKILCTLIRIPSECPNNILLKEAFNLQEAGLFKEFSILSLYTLLCNYFNSGTDQTIYTTQSPDSFVMFKPICLTGFKTRFTPNSNLDEILEGRVQNFIPIYSRSTLNIKNHTLPMCYSRGRLSEYEEASALYPSEESALRCIKEGKIMPQNKLRIVYAIYKAIKAQFPKLRVDYPEFK